MTLLRFFLLSALICLPATAAAQNPSSNGAAELTGGWKAYRFEGAVCSKLIRSLEYRFEQDGTYVIRSDVGSLGPRSATGTYTTKPSSETTGEVTGLVDGTTIGPFPYSIERGALVIRQPEPPCTIHLERLD